ncbi:MAG: 3-deoxy-manno-octulosonate cytidylyltransferase [Bdellovibrionales bacterium]|nr:3-deoxy-manno-octulosonate cytidylyltransferase [Bdellovibrionales bacterium]
MTGGRMVGVIPARYGSTRFPGKPLVNIAGKPLLAWVIEGARKSRLLQEIIVATDDVRIQGLAERMKCPVVMTDPNLPTGTDRIWAAVQTRQDVDVVVNIQGDEPLVNGEVLDSLCAPMAGDPNLQMATLGRSLAPSELNLFNTAKIVLNKNDEAIYFSRHPIPHSRVLPEGGECYALRHIGIYAYRRSFLKDFCACGATGIEIAEGLEQLRALYLGARIKVVRTGHESWGVDSPEDVLKVESLLRGESQP